jgi:hypothetical protein
VIRLADTYPPTRVKRACRRALDHDSPYYRTVKTLLNARPELLEAARAAPNPGAVYLDAARFARSARSLFPEDEQAIRVETYPVPATPTT